MALTQRLDLRQSQSLVMTPQLQQAIKLLQLSNLELADYVANEVEQNPLLEHDDGGNARDDGERPTGDESPITTDGMDADLLGTDRLAAAETLATDDQAPLDADYENVWPDTDPADPTDRAATQSLSRAGQSGGNGFDGGEFDPGQTLRADISLRDHLLGQVNTELNDPVDRLIGASLVELLDETGYLTEDLGTAAERLGCSVARTESVLSRLQAFDPPGVFARSLAECLALQLADRDRLDPAMRAFLDHLDLFARRDLQGLMMVCGVDLEDLTDMIAEIRALDPKPALAFGVQDAQPVIPDILVNPARDGGWLVELNTDALPRVLVNERYHATVSRQARTKADRDYLSERLASANWLTRSLHQRATTILKVATEIVRQQDEFLRQGVRGLKPLILRDIAEAIGMHESTVSRVSSSKFMATPLGVFELKYFFTTAIPGAGGTSAHSAEAVRHRIRGLIDSEPADRILSDDKIVDLLRGEGIDVARRTVAKYRESMNIPSSVQRRREKAFGLAP